MPSTLTLQPAIINVWQEHLAEKPNKLAITPQDSLPPGSCEMWPFRACLSGLRTAMGLCKANLVKWGYKRDGDISCLYREEQTVAHPGEEQTMDHLGEEQTMAHLGEEQTMAHLGRNKQWPILGSNKKWLILIPVC